MYLAKEKGKNNYQFFTEDLNKKAIRKRQIKNALRLAIEQNEFKLFYQPQVDLQTGKLIGMEALLRWYPSFGIVSPVEFIPIAEETGLILPIGEWVIKEACLQIKKWKNQNRPKIKVSVNVSARQFKDEEFALKVKKILEDEKVDPSFIEFEITESVMLNAEESSLLIREIKEMGIKVAIDDFGAGYSSLSVIKNVEIDTLKIDQSLLENVMQNSRMMSMLEAIIGVGKTLNTKIIVEGIETKEQLDLLNDFQIIGQGYFFSHPLPPEQLQDVWVRKWLQNE
jgi:EAL domain-containing protein (putative c-di-GMP-specific phosphodiesterase class I)